MSPKEEPLSIASVRFVTGRMPFLSPKQQCLSTFNKTRVTTKVYIFDMVELVY